MSSAVAAVVLSDDKISPDGAFGSRAPSIHLYHPLPNLLQMSAPEILQSYRCSQASDFAAAFDRLRSNGSTGNLSSAISLLDRYLAAYPNDALRHRLTTDSLHTLFKEMHDHVMAHPVWVHPFFVRFATGEFTKDQLRIFSQQYFNQVKNTRQCVALALGRFHTLLNRPDGHLNNALSELTQIVLAGLLADEYGVSTHSSHGTPGNDTSPPGEGSVDVADIFAPVTHAALYRRFLDLLNTGVDGYDVPLLHSVADNVLVQRILAGDPAYSHMEALASVGLGMEWGVPAFFSMLIAGILKSAQYQEMPDPAAMEIWTAHVHQDVVHAVAVMIVTSFFIRDADDITRVKNATNALMAFRYEMMSDIYRAVFAAPCTRIDEIDLEKVYLVEDRRLPEL